jgi:hypothetical protein
MANKEGESGRKRREKRKNALGYRYVRNVPPSHLCDLRNRDSQESGGAAGRVGDFEELHDDESEGEGDTGGAGSERISHTGERGRRRKITHAQFTPNTSPTINPSTFENSFATQTPRIAEIVLPKTTFRGCVRGESCAA